MCITLYRLTQEPVRVHLGERHVWKGSGDKRRCVTKADHFMYVPVLKTLESLLKNDAVLSEVCPFIIASL